MPSPQPPPHLQPLSVQGFGCLSSSAPVFPAPLLAPLPPAHGEAPGLVAPVPSEPRPCCHPSHLLLSPVTPSAPFLFSSFPHPSTFGFSNYQPQSDKAEILLNPFPVDNTTTFPQAGFPSPEPPCFWCNDSNTNISFYSCKAFHFPSAFSICSSHPSLPRLFQPIP